MEDEAAWLLERVRVGDLETEKLEMAAYCGHEAASVVQGDRASIRASAARADADSAQTWIQLPPLVPKASIVATARMIEAAHALFVDKQSEDPLLEGQRAVVSSVLERAMRTPFESVPPEQESQVQGWLQDSDFASDDLREAGRGYLLGALFQLCQATTALGSDDLAKSRVACGDAAVCSEGLVSLAFGCEEHDYECDHDPSAWLISEACLRVITHALSPSS